MAEEDVKVAEPAAEEPELILGEKKKKKKKKSAAEGEGGELDALADLGMGDLTGLKKKKKKKKARADDEFGLEGEEKDGQAEESGAGGKFPWSQSDRDYTYTELLDRVFGILREKNPELTGERRRTIMKPPQVAREGTKKTVFTNFMDLAKAMNRQPEHMQSFLMAELGTSGSLDGQNRLIVKGRFLPKAFEGVLRRYVNEYVLCHSCKGVDTLLDRDSATRLMHLRCQQCGASRTVSAIKTGFVARTTKRKH